MPPAGKRRIEPGQEAQVLFRPRKTRLRARFVRFEVNGDLTFVHPRNGGLRTVKPDDVGTVHRKKET